MVVIAALAFLHIALSRRLCALLRICTLLRIRTLLLRSWLIRALLLAFSSRLLLLLLLRLHRGARPLRLGVLLLRFALLRWCSVRSRRSLAASAAPAALVVGIAFLHARCCGFCGGFSGGWLLAFRSWPWRSWSGLHDLRFLRLLLRLLRQRFAGFSKKCIIELAHFDTTDRHV